MKHLLAHLLIFVLALSRGEGEAAPLAAATAPPAVIASLTMTSEAGDRIGGGKTYSFSSANGTFEAFRSAYEGVSITFSNGINSPGNQNWRLDFAGRFYGPLQPGTYTGATEFEMRQSTEPGLAVYGNGAYPTSVTGKFVVRKITYGPNATIASFWATFEQYANGATAALRGEIQYNIASSAPAENQAPAAYAGVTQRVKFPDPVQLLGQAQDDGLPAPLTAAWTKVSGPGTVTFSNAAQFQPTATFSALGDYLLQLAVSDGAITTTSLLWVSMIDPTLQTSLTMTSDAGEPIGRGQSYHFDLTTGVFSAHTQFGEERIDYTDGAQQSWTLTFKPPGNEPFAVGTYAGATEVPVGVSNRPGLSIDGDGYGSSSSTGTFTVKRAIYGPSQTLVSFWATFEFHPGGLAPALRGEVKFNAGDTEASLNQAPGVYAGPAARVLLPNALPLSGVAGDDRLPSGRLTTAWSMLSGPGKVTFGDATQLSTTALFSAAGKYVLQLGASDGVLSGASSLEVNVVDASLGDSLVMTSPPGEFIGQGRSYDYTLVDGDFTVTKAYFNEVSVFFTNPSGLDTWTLTFGAAGGALLTAGDYVGAGNFYSSTHPSLNVSGEARSGGLGGSFHVDQVTYGPGSTILSFHASFSQPSTVGGPPLVGEIKYFTSAGNLLNQAPTVSAGSNATVVLPHTLALVGTAADDGLPKAVLTTAWSALSGPGVVTFADRSAMKTTASFPVVGTYTLQLSATDGALTAKSQIVVTVTDPTLVTSLELSSDPGDLIGGGQSLHATPAQGSFAAVPNQAHGVSVSYRSPADGHLWRLDFAAPGKAPLTVGSYRGATRFAAQSPGTPGLDISVDGRSLYAFSGSFNVYEVRSGIDSSIVAFHASFVLRSQAAAPAFRGEIEYQASASPTINLAPVVTLGGSAQVTLPETLMVSGAISDDGLPSHKTTCAWSVLSGPGTVTFADPAAAQTTAAFSAGGAYILQLTASDGQFESSREMSAIAIDRAVGTMLALTSDADDPAGLGNGYYYSPPGSSFMLDLSPPNGVKISVASGTQTWTMGFFAPGSERLEAGTYLNAADFGGAVSAFPGMYVMPDHRPVTGLAGSFTVKRISYGLAGRIVSFWAVFEMHAGGGGPALHGEIKYDVPPIVPAMAGSYQGLVFGVDRGVAGALQVNVTRTSMVTGQLTLGSSSYAFHGAWSAEGTWQGSLSPTEPGLILLLVPNADGTLSASITSQDGEWNAALDLVEPFETTVFPAALAGRYAVALIATDEDTGQTVGTGWAFLILNSRGAAWLAGKTPDGTPFCYATHASPTGVLAVNARMIAQQTVVAGMLRFTAGADSELAGTLQWIRQRPVGMGSATSMAISGAPLTVQGSRIAKLTAKEEPLDSSASPVETTLTLVEPDGATDAIPLTLKGRWGYPGVTGGQAITLVSTADGIFAGWTRDTHGTAITFDGVFLQRAQVGFGRFSIGGGYGSVKVERAVR